jgi:hypothetical protein
MRLEVKLKKENYLQTVLLFWKKTYFGLMRSRIRAQAMIAPEFSMGL